MLSLKSKISNTVISIMSIFQKGRTLLLGICALLSTISPVLYAGTGLPGDVNQDGALTVADYALLQCYVLGNGTLTGEEQVVADVAPLNSPDGLLDESDLLLLEGAIMGRVGLPLSPSLTTLPTLLGFFAPPNSGNVLTESLSGYQMGLGVPLAYDTPNAVTIPSGTTPTTIAGSGQVPAITYGGFARNILMLSVQDFTNNPTSGSSGGRGGLKPDLGWGAWRSGSGSWVGGYKSLDPVTREEVLKASAGDTNAGIDNQGSTTENTPSVGGPATGASITTDPSKVRGVHPLAMTLVLEEDVYRPVRVFYTGDPLLDVQDGDTDFISFDFSTDANGTSNVFFTEATEFYGSFLIDTGPVQLTESEINGYAQWCLANWMQGNYALPPQLQKNLYLMMDTFDAPDQVLPGTTFEDFQRQPIVGPNMIYVETPDNQVFRIVNNALRADTRGASGWGTRQSRTSSVFHTIEARYKNYQLVASGGNSIGLAQHAVKLTIRENDEDWSAGGVTIIISTSSDGTDLYLYMEARQSPGENRDSIIQGGEKIYIGQLLDPSTPFDVVIEDDGTNIRAGVKGAVFNNGNGDTSIGNMLSFSSSHAAATANGYFWHDFASTANKLELLQIIVWND